MRLDSALVTDAQAIASTMHRSTAEQIEHWSALGQRLSEALTAQQIAQFLTGIGQITFVQSEHEPIYVMALSEKVEKDSQSGALAQELLSKGHTLYQPSPQGNGILEAIKPDGSRVLGAFKNGVFKALKTSASA
jgi:hypothetical protein